MIMKRLKAGSLKELFSAAEMENEDTANFGARRP